MGQFRPVRRCNVLVVQDEAVLRLDAIDLVEQAGFAPVEAKSVDEAIHILEERSDIQIVYMDLDLPRGIKGIEFAALIRHRWPPIEIILTAAFFTRNDLTLPIRAEFLPKPVAGTQVIAAMRRMTADHDSR